VAEFDLISIIHLAVQKQSVSRLDKQIFYSLAYKLLAGPPTNFMVDWELELLITTAINYKKIILIGAPYFFDITTINKAILTLLTILPIKEVVAK